MLAVAPVGKKANIPSINGGPVSHNNFEVKSTNDDFAISNNGELEMFKRPNDDTLCGRDDPRNILGDVYVGRKP